METFTAVMQSIILPLVIVLAYLSYRNYKMAKVRMTKIEERVAELERRRP